MNIRQLIKEEIQLQLNEFEEDLGKKAIILAGLPAAGKSTFINNDIDKYIPDISGFNISASDQQVMMLQYHTARDHFNILTKRIGKQKVDDSKIQKEIINFKNKSSYINNNKKNIIHPITAEWWKNNKQKGLKHFYKIFYKQYYATYFDIRDLAKQINKHIFKTKITKAANIVVIETIGNKPATMFNKLQALKDAGFQTTIVYLEIDPELSIVRDKYREKSQGRGVGASAIVAHADKLDSAMNIYKKNGEQVDGVVDRLLHFKWKQFGDSPIDGAYIKQSDNRYGVKRKIKTRKNK